MSKITPVSVEVTHYQTSDGRVFSKLNLAEDHQRRLDGIRETCTECNGYGKVDPYGDDRVYYSCPECKGMGWVDHE